MRSLSVEAVGRFCSYLESDHPDGSLLFPKIPQRSHLRPRVELFSIFPPRQNNGRRVAQTGCVTHVTESSSRVPYDRLFVFPAKWLGPEPYKVPRWEIILDIENSTR